MTAIDFPNSPALNDEFSASGRTWKWDGTKWEAVASTTIAPTAHASSHASGGADAVTVAQSQVTDLATNLAAKASLTGVETLTNKTLTSPVLGGAALESFNGFAGFAGFTFYATTNGAVQTTFGGNATANGAVNITSTASQTLNTLMTIGQSMTVSLLIQNGATAYYPTSIQVDGTATGVTTRWSGGTAPTSGNANSIDVYSFTVFKVANAQFYVWASLTKFA